jgi:uncharacterized protein
MSLASSGLAERLRLAFFRTFFSALLIVIAVCEVLVVVRIARRIGLVVPPLMSVLGVAGLYAVNVVLAPRARREARQPFVTAYAGVAFTALFGGLFVALTELVWTIVAFAAPPAVRMAGALPTLDAALWRPRFEVGVDIGLASIAALFLFGYTAGRRALDVSVQRVAIAGLSPSLAGFRIVHVSDLHMGKFLQREELAQHVARINALDPDLICITGDLVDRAATCTDAFPVLADLRARHGVLVTLGNHDVAAGADAVTAALRALTPFTVLRNQRITVERDGATLEIIGLDDLGRDWARGVPEHPALPLLAGAVAAETPLVVLSHRPDCFEQAAALGASLVLAGHTHGGQIGLPSVVSGRVRNPAEAITRYDRGVFRSGTATLVVSNGLGFTAQPVRLFTPRQIGCLDLHPA